MSLAEDFRASPRFDSAESFLAWAEVQPERWELWDGVARMKFGDGVARMMTGGSLNHSRIARNALTALAARLGTGPCEAFGSDAAGVLGPLSVAYPDASVSCEPEDGASLSHPAVIVEVLSPSTQSYDSGSKAVAYRRLPSLRHLVLVHQDRILVQHFHRAAAAEEFRLTEIDRVDAARALTGVGVEIGVAALYAQVRFSA